MEITRSDENNNINRGRLKYGNPSGNPRSSPRCEAKTRSGAPCRGPAMRSRKTGRYTRCRMHGGASTGPKTPEGLARCGKANFRHGRYTKEMRELTRKYRDLLTSVNDLIRRCLDLDENDPASTPYRSKHD